MYTIGQEPILLADTLKDMKRDLKLSCEAHIARCYGTFVVVGDNGVRYDIRVEIKLEKK